MVSALGLYIAPVPVPIGVLSPADGTAAPAANGNTPSPASGTSAPAAGAALDATRQVSGELDLTTRDGDTVEISASFAASLTYRPGATSTPGSLVVKGQQGVSVTVSGSLDPRERHDIGRIVRRFLHDLQTALQGGPTSLANLERVGGRSLASLAATIQTSTTLDASNGASSAPGAAATDGASAASDVAPPASTATAQPASPSAIAA
ncbi:MAG TPA: hypothetical protein VMH61_07455 [Candidatus Acidoferrales bacterium]|nr:hypothetical protein [Candidatus Acidoferrales bacterium]